MPPNLIDADSFSPDIRDFIYLLHKHRVDYMIFRDAWPNRETTEMQVNEKAIPVIYIGKKNLITNKHAAGRPKDLDDLSYLKTTAFHEKPE